MARRNRAPRQVAFGVRIRRPSYVLISVVLAILVVGSAMLFGTSQRVVCAACHAPQAAAHASAGHSGASCYTCHLRGGWWGIAEAKSDEFLRMYPRMLLNGGRLRSPGAKVSREACVSCHKELPRVAVASGLLIRHEKCAPAPGGCDECHSGIAHGDKVRWARKPRMDDCLECHSEQGAPRECITCHEGKIDPERRLKNGPWQVTHGPNWKKTHGMGDLDTCVTCHEPSKCAGCHGTELPHKKSFFITHGKQSISSEGDCTTCHSKKEFCDRCHGMAMPHPAGFLKEHPRKAAGQDDPRCRKCHRALDCSNCHVMHTHPGSTDGFLDEVKKNGMAR